jgi:hypothetical protein
MESFMQSRRTLVTRHLQAALRMAADELPVLGEGHVTLARISAEAAEVERERSKAASERDEAARTCKTS